MTHPNLETLSDAGDALAATCSALMVWAQTEGLDCTLEREAIAEWNRTNTTLMAHATQPPTASD